MYCLSSLLRLSHFISLYISLLSQESERLKQPLNSLGVSAACFCNLWQIVDTREADMHLFFCVISDLITTRQFNWTNISKDEKVNINYVIFSFIFFLESPLFINNAMIKLHDTQVVVTWRTLPGHVDYGLIIWSLLGHLSDCFITWRVSLM